MPPVSAAAAVVALTWVKPHSAFVVRQLAGLLVESFELAAEYRDQEYGDGAEDDDDAKRNQQVETGHGSTGRIGGMGGVGPALPRWALSTTSSEDSDMPAAASHGGSWPVIASGSTSRL